MVGVFFFLAVDERDLGDWQSGLYYPDDTPKKSQPLVKAAVEKARNGGIRC
ncbi:MAG: hypothetical protein HYW38_00455 [Candidatus Colwellbacteria bacterium]|nr:hypothetical protein [Candidatus Colwellbacteria bacterium]